MTSLETQASANGEFSFDVGTTIQLHRGRARDSSKQISIAMINNVSHTENGSQRSPPDGGNYAASESGNAKSDASICLEEGNYIRMHGTVVLIRRKRLEEILGLSRSTIYRLKNKKSKWYDPSFPQPIRYGNGRAVYWIAEEVADWVEAQIRRSRGVNMGTKKKGRS